MNVLEPFWLGSELKSPVKRDEAVNRTQFQQLAEERLRDAETLLDAGRWSGASYLAGYAVECGLKARIARLTKLHDYPHKEVAIKCYIHKIETLVEVAGFNSLRDSTSAANDALAQNWMIVKEWDEKARYLSWTEYQSRRLVAVSDPINGV